MKLHRDEPWMRRQLRDLDELSVGRTARHLHPAFRQGRLVETIELKPMAMALVDQVLAVDALCDRAWNELAGVAAKPHGAAKFVHTQQITQFVNDFVRRVLVDFG